jgi:hypothetical protein
MDKEVTAYIKKQKSPMREIAESLRKIVLQTFPKIEEEMKMGVPWYEGKFYIVALKDSVNLGFSVQGLDKKEMDFFKGKGEYMRHLKMKSLEDIDEKDLVKLLKLVKRKTVEYHK